jgi:hypothetical protein
MKPNIKRAAQILCCALAVIFLGNLAYSATPKARQVADDKKGKVTGTILSRNGDIVNVKNKKSGTLTAVLITDDTKIDRKSGYIQFSRGKEIGHSVRS